MFFTVNMMNNFAFAYDISVPVHIILRSGGSVTTMLVGFLWGKRYGKGQVFGVAMLTVGVIIAAMADAQSKVPAQNLQKFNCPVVLTDWLVGQNRQAITGWFHGVVSHGSLYSLRGPASLGDHGPVCAKHIC